MICVLTGGTGGAKFVDGLRQVMPGEEITLVVNTGDDLLWWGLYVSPDIDSITYVLPECSSANAGGASRAILSFACRPWGNSESPRGFTPATATSPCTCCVPVCWPKAKHSPRPPLSSLENLE